MDDQIANRKILSLRRCFDRIEQLLPDSVSALKADVDTQDILSINLQRAAQLCVDLAVMRISDSQENVPDSMPDSFTVLEHLGVIDTNIAKSMISAVGFRNVAVH